MRRREFIAGLGGAAALAMPRVGRTQQSERVRRVGVLMALDETDPEAKAQLSGFTKGLAELGWSDGRNLRMDVRWAADSVDRMRMFAKELVGLQPDVILANSTPVTAALQRETRTIPIVFAPTSDPVGSGFVVSLARPGGNITGFINIEAEMAGKWLGLLTEIAPRVRRALFPSYKAAGVHRRARRGGVAVCDEGAAASSGDRVRLLRIGRCLGGLCGRVPQGAWRNRLRRGPERDG